MESRTGCLLTSGGGCMVSLATLGLQGSAVCCWHSFGILHCGLQCIDMLRRSMRARHWTGCSLTSGEGCVADWQPCGFSLCGGVLAVLFACCIGDCNALACCTGWCVLDFAGCFVMQVCIVLQQMQVDCILTSGCQAGLRSCCCLHG